MIYKSIVENRLDVFDTTGQISKMKAYTLEKVFSSFSKFKNSRDVNTNKTMHLQINILWTMCMDSYHCEDGKFCQFLEDTLRSINKQKLNHIDIAQLYNIFVALKIEAPEIYQKIDSDLVKHIVDKKKDSFDSIINKTHQYVESFSKDVYKVIKKELSSYTLVEEVYNGLLSNDIWVKELNLIIEVDGYTHFYSNTTHEIQNSIFKYRLYEKAEIKQNDGTAVKLLNYIRIRPSDFKSEKELCEILNNTIKQQDKIDRNRYLESPHNAFDKLLITC